MADVLVIMGVNLTLALIDTKLECAQRAVDRGFDGEDVTVVDGVFKTLVAQYRIHRKIGMDMQ